MNSYIAWSVVGLIWVFIVAPSFFSPDGHVSYKADVINGAIVTVVLAMAIGAMVLAIISIDYLL